MKGGLALQTSGVCVYGIYIVNIVRKCLVLMPKYRCNIESSGGNCARGGGGSYSIRVCLV